MGRRAVVWKTRYRFSDRYPWWRSAAIFSAKVCRAADQEYLWLRRHGFAMRQIFGEDRVLLIPVESEFRVSEYADQLFGCRPGNYRDTFTALAYAPDRHHGAALEYQRRDDDMGVDHTTRSGRGLRRVATLLGAGGAFLLSGFPYFLALYPCGNVCRLKYVADWSVARVARLERGRLAGIPFGNSRERSAPAVAALQPGYEIAAWCRDCVARSNQPQN